MEVDLCWLFAAPWIGLVVYLVLRYIWELKMIPDLYDRVVVITGCDTGFGRALAIKCAKAGITVYGACLTPEGKRKLDNTGLNTLHTILLDVTNDESVNKARDHIEKMSRKARSKLLALVNNAGIFSCYGPAEWCTMDEYKLAFEVNTLGVIRCTNAFLGMLKEDRGRVITVASTLGRVTIPGAAPYCVSKYAVESYMDAIRRELKPWGVTCSILEPGGCKATQLLDEAAMEKRVNSVWDKLSPEVKEEYGEEFKQTFITGWNEVIDKVATPNINYVVDNYFHAITAVYPRLRYHCGWDAILMFIPVTFLPTFLEDWAIGLVKSAKVAVPKRLLTDKKN